MSGSTCRAIAGASAIVMGPVSSVLAKKVEQLKPMCGLER